MMKDEHEWQAFKMVDDHIVEVNEKVSVCLRDFSNATG